MGTLCSNTLGQAMMASVCNPPKEGEPSFVTFNTERSHILEGMARKATLVAERVNKIEGLTAMPIEGAMYAFPQVELPQKYCEHAASAGKKPDTLYCIELLRKTGVLVVPGNGFGQRKDTFHFRMTILPEDEDLKTMLESLENFQKEMYEKYGSKYPGRGRCSFKRLRGRHGQP